MNILVSESADFNEDKGYEATLRLMEEHPTANVIYSHNDAMSFGVITALEELGKVPGEDVLIVQSREHRTQAANREAARTRLEDLIARASHRPRKRRATKPTAASRERRLSDKKRRGAAKQRRASSVGDD